MARLTLKQVNQLNMIISKIERAHGFIMSDHIAIARKGDKATTTLHYIRGDNATLYEINKGIGSELCLLEDGLRHLRRFLLAYTSYPSYQQELDND